MYCTVMSYTKYSALWYEFSWIRSTAADNLQNGLPTFLLEFQTVFGIPNLFLEFRTYSLELPRSSEFKKYEIDVFHLPNPVPLFNTFGVPHVVTMHDAAEYSGHRYRNLHRYFRIFVNESSAKRAAVILTVSEFSKSEISNFIEIEESKIHVTHPGLLWIFIQNIYQYIVILSLIFCMWEEHFPTKT